jgi:hypothetical protein
MSRPDKVGKRLKQGYEKATIKDIERLNVVSGNLVLLKKKEG